MATDAMLRYILRRILQMIPTVFGVILITFVLFNVVGGSPAAMTLGKHASPQALEEFDEVRGFNKPLLLGRWARTRALERCPRSTRNAGPWREVEGVSHREPEGRLPGRIVLPAGGTTRCRWPSRSGKDQAYRLVVEYRTAAGAEPSFLVRTAAARRGRGRSRWSRPEPGALARARLDPGPAADSTRPAGRPTPVPVLQVEGTDMEIKSVRLAAPGRQPVRLPARASTSSQIAALRLRHLLAAPTSGCRSMLLDGMLPSLMLTVPIFLVGLVVDHRPVPGLRLLPQPVHRPLLRGAGRGA